MAKIGTILQMLVNILKNMRVTVRVGCVRFHRKQRRGMSGMMIQAVLGQVIILLTLLLSTFRSLMLLRASNLSMNPGGGIGISTMKPGPNQNAALDRFIDLLFGQCSIIITNIYFMLRNIMY
jgi:hypothetical protein